jgi:hypothetical protein
MKTVIAGEKMIEQPLIFMPVGTSLLTNADDGFNDRKLLENGRQLPKEKYFEKIRKYPGLHLFFSEAPGFQGRIRHPAEISSLYAFCREHWAGCCKPVESVRLLLLYSADPVGSYCADVLAELLSDRDYLHFPGLPEIEVIDWNVEMCPLKRLDPKDPDGFHIALDGLAEIVARELRVHKGSVYVNISGGYKPLGNYLTLMAMALGRRLRVFYLYEQSPQVHFLPSYPLSFDLLQWRDWRGLLLPFMHRDLFTPRQQDNFYAALRETPVGGLVRVSGTDEPEVVDDCGPASAGYTLNSVGRILQGLYEQSRREDISRFGRGHLLLDLLEKQEPGWVDYLAEVCIPRWRHLAVGDHIPETVEHGRGHVQRLLELARQLLEILAVGKPPLKLTSEQLFVLIGAIWLHDLGHSGDEFFWGGEAGLVQSLENPSSTEPFFVYGDPDQVRRYHNFLSWHIIESERCKGECNFLFPHAEGMPEKLDCLIHSVALAALYHRRVMPVKGGREIGDCRVTKGFCDFTKSDGVIDGFPLVAALLRVLDGAENQQERSGSPESSKVTEWVVARQTDSMRRYLGKSFDAVLQKKYEFKKKQPQHYCRHQLIRHVFFALEDEERRELDPEYIYGNEGVALLVGFYLAINPDAMADKKPGDREQIIIDEIITPFIEEFQLVERLLPFRLVLYCISGLGPGEEPELRQAWVEKREFSPPLATAETCLES